MIQKLIPRILNMESDESLVKPNEFIDAINVKVDGEDGVDFGVIKYADGNVIIEFEGSPTAPASKEIVTGFVEDESDDRIYVFCATPPAQADSIYMIHKVNGAYVATLLARSAKFDFDKDKLTVGNILRTYDKSITDTESDDGTGFFGDENVLTDFDPTTIITSAQEEGEGGFTDIVVFPNVNQSGIIDFPAGGDPFVSTHTVLIQNNGTNSGEVSISYGVDIGVYGDSPETYGYITNDTLINGSISNGSALTYTIPPQGNVLLTLTHVTDIVSGSFQDDWQWTPSISIFSPTVDFLPINFDWTVTLNELSSGRGTPEFGPNPGLDAGDFVPVDTGIPTSQSKTYSITNVPGDFNETIDMTGTIKINPTTAFVSTHDPSYTFIRYVDGNGDVVVKDADTNGGDPATFAIPAGEIFTFDLVLDIPSGVEEPYADEVRLFIQFTDETGGVIPVEGNPVVQSAPCSYQIQEVIVVDDSNPPALIVNPNPGFEEFYEFEPIAAVGGDEFGGATYSEIGYIINNLGGAGAIQFNVEVINESVEGLISPYLSSLIEAQYVNGDISNINESYSPALSTFTVQVPEASPESPFSRQLNFLIGYTPFGTTSDISLQNAVNSQGGASVGAVVRVTAFAVGGAENPPPLIDKTFNLVFNPLLFGSGRPYLYHVDEGTLATSNPLDQYAPPQFGTGGAWLPLYRPNIEGSFLLDNAAAVQQIALEFKNDGTLPISLPTVKLSNTRYRKSGSLLGTYASTSNNTYITNPAFNQEYLANDEAWMGYGAIYKGNHPQLQGLSGPTLTAAFSSTSDQSSFIYLEGYHDFAYSNGWQVNRYTILDSNLNSEGQRVYTNTERSALPYGWFSTINPIGTTIEDVIPAISANDNFEPADGDGYSFEMRDVHGWWQGVPSGATSEEAARISFSGWFKQAGGGGNSFNSSGLDAVPDNIEVIADNAQIDPGESAYMIFNCNVPQTPSNISEPDIYEALLQINSAPDTVQNASGAVWKFILKGTTGALSAFRPSPIPSKSPELPESGSEVGLIEEDERSTQYGVSRQVSGPKEIKAKPRSISPKSSRKAIDRATLKRIDKDGRRY